MAWAAWVVFLNGGTLVATFSLILMVTGAAIAFLVTPAFGLVTAGCVIMSVLYSHDAFRWKSIPGRDLAINIVGYGGATTLSGIMAGQVALGATSISPDLAGWLLIAGFGFLFGSFYPLTQIYQLDTDRDRGDLILAAAMGTGKALTLAIVLGIIAAIFLAGAAWLWNDAFIPVLPLLSALMVWMAMLAVWHRRSARMDAAAHEKGMYIALIIWAVIDLSVLISRYANQESPYRGNLTSTMLT